METDIDPDFPDIRFPCLQCTRQFPSKQRLKKHQEKEHTSFQTPVGDNAKIGNYINTIKVDRLFKLSKFQPSHVLSVQMDSQQRSFLEYTRKSVTSMISIALSVMGFQMMKPISVWTEVQLMALSEISRIRLATLNLQVKKI